MVRTSLSQLSEFLHARRHGNDVEFTQISKDTRSMQKGHIYIALRGKNFDGHSFAAEAVDKGAAGLIVDKFMNIEVPQLVVDDCFTALGQIAHYNRERLTAKLIAVTGSSGKTTVKEMIATILQLQGKTSATKGNLNNEIGAPLTLLEMDESYQYGVIELGASRLGDIAYTSAIVEPDVALVNNVAGAHLEGFGSLENIAKAKGEIYESLNNDGVAVINNDDVFATIWKQDIHQSILTYGIDEQSDVMATKIVIDDNQIAEFDLTYKDDSVKVKLPLIGAHQVKNALAAAACCLAIGLSLEQIADGLQQVKVVAGRTNMIKLNSGCRVIDDTYNANLASMKAAISLLSGYKGKKILVIGDMAELGRFSRQHHTELGSFAAENGIDQLMSCGEESKYAFEAFGGEGCHFENQQDLIEALNNETKLDTTILVKGSRSARMENIVASLLEQEQQEMKASQLRGN
ncbi:MAG: UDP-N-acetylmuramoyl-tripeptide--D-alanyl-D-alanine ligase [Gammaproteobacteria bacterium]|nr:UDP-N-acetylmuramoyl-tripeptide--D-alanyl-D-alanine ligase [Gammaproteobacteria bacterium]